MASINIRSETTEDITSIRRVNAEAFGRKAEANLVDALRSNGRATLSLVALDHGSVAGHILFSPLTIEAEGARHEALGLGPMAVLPEFQRQGIGSALVRAGLEELTRQGHGAVIVLGHPDFYPRFGFVPASRYGISSKYKVPDEVFMARELLPGALSGKSGLVVYSTEFDEV